MADNIMNDNAKDNNADNNVIEFDSKVTEKDLLRFKFYHKYHTISGMAEIMLALIMIVLCVISIGRVNASYSLMVGVFGVFFLVFPSVDMKHRAKRHFRHRPFRMEGRCYVCNSDHRAAGQAHGLPWPQGAGKGVRRAGR